MVTDLDPIRGNSYRHLDDGQAFPEVAVDGQAGVAANSHFDGDVDQLELDAWYEMEIKLFEAPVNQSGPLEAIHVPERRVAAKEEFNEEWGKSHLQEERLPEEI